VIALGVHLGREKGDSVVTVMDIVEVPDLVVNLVEKRVELQPTIDLLSGVLVEDLALDVVLVALELQLVPMMLKCNGFLLRLMRFWMY
jgi:hypothetical protein